MKHAVVFLCFFVLPCTTPDTRLLLITIHFISLSCLLRATWPADYSLNSTMSSLTDLCCLVFLEKQMGHYTYTKPMSHSSRCPFSLHA